MGLNDTPQANRVHIAFFGPRALIPAITALGTISLYDNKICTGDEAAECRLCMEGRIRGFGFVPDMARGDWADRLLVGRYEW
jgi:hypothetical protein